MRWILIALMPPLICADISTEQMKAPDPPLQVMLRKEDQTSKVEGFERVPAELAHVFRDSQQRLFSAANRLAEARMAVENASNRRQLLEAENQVPIREAQFKAAWLEVNGIREILKRRYGFDSAEVGATTQPAR